MQSMSADDHFAWVNYLIWHQSCWWHIYGKWCRKIKKSLMMIADESSKGRVCLPNVGFPSPRALVKRYSTKLTAFAHRSVSRLFWFFTRGQVVIVQQGTTDAKSAWDWTAKETQASCTRRVWVALLLCRCWRHRRRRRDKDRNRDRERGILLVAVFNYRFAFVSDVPMICMWRVSLWRDITAWKVRVHKCTFRRRPHMPFSWRRMMQICVMDTKESVQTCTDVNDH